MYAFTTRACRRLHDGMLDRVLRFPMSFFDVTPSGRIINRFSKDVETLDSTLPGLLIQLFGCLTNILVTLVLIAIGSQWFLIAVFPIMLIYHLIQRRAVCSPALRCAGPCRPARKEIADD